MRPFLWSAAVALALTATLAAGPAAAQQPGQSTAIAEALFQQGRDLLKEKKYAEACPKFAESQRLEPKLGTLMNLAVCHAEEGKTATAWAEFTSAATLANREGQRERAAYATGQVAALGAKLSHVTITAAGPAIPAITLDGRPLQGALLGAPLPIDPGEHTVVATAPGKKDWSRTFSVPSTKSAIPVAIPVLEGAAAAPAPVAPLPTTQPPPAIEPGPSVEPTRIDERTMLIYGGLGVGAIGLLTGTITGAITLSKAGDLKDACGDDGPCPKSQEDALGSASTMANISNVGFALGALGLGAAAIGLFVLEPGDGGTSASVTAVVGPGAVGVRGAF